MFPSALWRGNLCRAKQFVSTFDGVCNIRPAENKRDIYTRRIGALDAPTFGSSSGVLRGRTEPCPYKLVHDKSNHAPMTPGDSGPACRGVRPAGYCRPHPSRHRFYATRASCQCWLCPPTQDQM